MAPADEALTHLRLIITEFECFCTEHGVVTEADTRANVIDRILTEVFQWPSLSIKREQHANPGFIDYALLLPKRPFVAVEAKKEGAAFAFPIGNTHRTLKLSGSVLTNAAIKEAVEQVQRYCVNQGIRYGIATNGYSWIVFRAIREDMPWKEGHAVVFRSLQDIADHFTEAWNLLSYTAIASGSLDAEFGSPLRVQRELHRVLDYLYNADLPLLRNRLHSHLHPFIKTIFEDIAEQSQLEILQRCYVYSQSLKIVTHDLGFVITDAIPKFLSDEGAMQIQQDRWSAGAFGDVVSTSIPHDQGQLCLLLGGIGSGKSTFLRRYQRTVGAALLEKHTLWFAINFLEAPVDPQQMEEFVWTTVLGQLRTRYHAENLEIRKNIKKAFSAEIKAISETALRGLPVGSGQYEKALTPFLTKWQEDLKTYVPKLLALCKPLKNTKIVLFIDNVDQLSSAYQAQIFLLGQRITRTIGSISIIALREESYYSANVQKTFTAYTNHKFHIGSPRFLWVVKNRIDYALQVLQKADQLELLGATPGPALKKDIADYLSIVERSIFEGNKNIIWFIESICFGNMRLALEMFTTFLASGATDVDKMLAIFRKTGTYSVAYHEFVRSIMLGDRRFYKESHSPVLNVFDCGLERNSSHFTSLRILALLLERSGENTVEGKGYFEISRAVSMFEDVFNNREDFVRSANRLVSKQLIEVNTRSTESILGASHARITSAGWYYLKRFVHTFAYLDLALQDTPLSDKATAIKIKDSLVVVDNLGDPDEQKIDRMKARFDRVEIFLSYLDKEEQDERARFQLDARESVLCNPILPGIREMYLDQKEWILQRLSQTRERSELSETVPTTEAEQAFLNRLHLDLKALEEDPEVTDDVQG